MLRDYFGGLFGEPAENIVLGLMKEYWNEDNTDVRTYFEKLDARVAELYHDLRSTDN